MALVRWNQEDVKKVQYLHEHLWHLVILSSKRQLYMSFLEVRFLKADVVNKIELI